MMRINGNMQRVSWADLTEYGAERAEDAFSRQSKGENEIFNESKQRLLGKEKRKLLLALSYLERELKRSGEERQRRDGGRVSKGSSTSYLQVL